MITLARDHEEEIALIETSRLQRLAMACSIATENETMTAWTPKHGTVAAELHAMADEADWLEYATYAAMVADGQAMFSDSMVEQGINGCFEVEQRIRAKAK